MSQLDKTSRKPRSVPSIPAKGLPPGHLGQTKAPCPTQKATTSGYIFAHGGSGDPLEPARQRPQSGGGGTRLPEFGSVSKER